MNQKLFYDIRVVSDGKNYGTCFNYTKTWEFIDGQYCKITAGDDVYAFTNLFANLSLLDSNEIYSGLPLLLIDGAVKSSFSQIFHILATDCLYRRKDFGQRLRRISVINAPSIFLSTKIFSNVRVADYIRRFRVVEDFPLFVALSKEYQPLKFEQTHQVNVYYRRTQGSTYLARPTEFVSDKDRVYQHLISETLNPIERLLLKNRLMCFRMGGRFLKIVLNLNYYLYGALILSKIFDIINALGKVSEKISDHQQHFDSIKANAEVIRLEFARKCL